MLNQRKWKKRKTSARKGTAAPYFNEAFAFLVPFGQIQVSCLRKGEGGSSLGAELSTVFLFPERGPGAGHLGPGPAAPGRAGG